MCSFSEERVACFLDINTQCSMEFEIQHVQLKRIIFYYVWLWLGTGGGGKQAGEGHILTFIYNLVTTRFYIEYIRQNVL